MTVRSIGLIFVFICLTGCGFQESERCNWKENLPALNEYRRNFEMILSVTDENILAVDDRCPGAYASVSLSDLNENDLVSILIDKARAQGGGSIDVVADIHVVHSEYEFPVIHASGVILKKRVLQDNFEDTLPN